MASTRKPTKSKSVVDRSVVSILPEPDNTPSFREGISPDVERKHRLYGTSLLSAACHLLKLEDASTYATACTIFHRFYHRISLRKHCVWSVAMASLLLATKIEDGPQQRNVRTIILSFDHLYRKRRGCISKEMPPEKQVLAMPKLGPVWKEYYELVLDMENRILRELGFTLYWIPDSHPHKFLWEFLRVLFQLEERPQPGSSVATEGPETNGGDKNDSGQNNTNYKHHELAQRAWNFCNDSCRLDLCVRFEPEVITCASIYLAALDLQVSLPANPRPWWELFLVEGDVSNGNGRANNSRCTSQKLSTAANAILGLTEYERVDPSHKTFLPSLVDSGSFNDPDSFIWQSRAPTD